ncbi:hypothetical protein SAMN05421824_0890 [Hyunsoonleella jejuensis]|uniref:Uncharacterized protein n=1 Tax=Hyunsoonleella jejuensis TaxID=419940 RepID=A0A1H9CEN4_9FLAO|nr:hypothetical protein SAMN05421824_0890 [Hyunsoonleella jejuensis]
MTINFKNNTAMLRLSVLINYYLSDEKEVANE